MIEFDCGMTDAEHCALESWLQIYEFVMEFHKTVGDIYKLANRYTSVYGSHKENDSIADFHFDLCEMHKPLLLELQKANKKISAKYCLDKANNVLQNKGEESSK